MNSRHTITYFCDAIPDGESRCPTKLVYVGDSDHEAGIYATVECGWTRNGQDEHHCPQHQYEAWSQS